MWAALRSDLEEFVTGVADETDQVLQTTNAVNGEGEVVAEGFAATGAIRSPEDEVTRLSGLAETYSEALDEADESVQAFLDSFEIDDKTDEISKLLDSNPDTIKVQFEALVPTQISYELFWQRYFYRCDPERVAEQLQKQEEARQQARSEAISGGIASVTNLFGGAISAVSQTLEKADQSTGEVPVSPFQFQGMPTTKEGSTAGGGINLFGSNGRPPFVMNTAVDEDGDEEEEEEEELGWDDDDDDDDFDDEEEANEEEQLEEITFTGGRTAVMDKMNEDLAQAISERDSLKETIELQKKEIAALREGTPASSDESAKELEKLKVTVFERESELAALRATLEDTHDDDKDGKTTKDTAKIASLERDVERLTASLSEKDKELESAKEQIDAAKEETVRTREAAASAQEILQDSLDTAKTEAETLRHSLDALSGTNSDELNKAKKEASLAESKVETLESELETAKQELADSKTTVEDLKTAMAKLNEKLVHMETTQAAKTVSGDEHRASPSSESTGVKVESPAEAPKIPKDRNGAEEEEDDWGDDWGEEDD